MTNSTIIYIVTPVVGEGFPRPAPFEIVAANEDALKATLRARRRPSDGCVAWTPHDSIHSYYTWVVG